MDSLTVRVGEFKLAKSNTEGFIVKASPLGGVKKKRAEISFREQNGELPETLSDVSPRFEHAQKHHQQVCLTTYTD